MKKLSMILIFMIVILGSSGCTKKCVYPTFPKPSDKVLSDLQKTNSSDVAQWMKELLKLKMKLEE